MENKGSGRSRAPSSQRSRSRGARRRSGRVSGSPVAGPGRKPVDSSKGTYASYVETSLKASSEEVHQGLLAKFFGSTKRGAIMEELSLTHVAARVRAWGPVVHDLHDFSDEELQKDFAQDPAAGDGPSLSRVGNHRTVVTEAVALARLLSKEDTPEPDIEDFLGRPSGHLPGARPSRSHGSPGASRSPRRASRSRKRSRSRTPPIPAPPVIDPLQRAFYQKAIEQFKTKGSKPHHLDHPLNKIHFDMTGVRHRPVESDHSCIDPLSFLDHDRHDLRTEAGLRGLPGGQPRLPIFPPHARRVFPSQGFYLGTFLFPSRFSGL